MIREQLSTVLGSLSTADRITVLTWVLAPLLVTWETARLNHLDDRHARQRNTETVTALKMAGGAIVVGIVYGKVFTTLYLGVSAAAPVNLSEFWLRHPVAAAAAAFVLWDLSGYLYHWVGHRTRWGWAAHQVHHSGSEFNASLALRLTWMPWHGLLHHPLIALSGLPLSYVLASLAVSNVLQALQHSRCLPSPPRWLAAAVMTPETHVHHHLGGGGAVNLGPVFTIWDRLAGTWRPQGLVTTDGIQPDADPFPAMHSDGGTLVGPERSAWAVQSLGWRKLLRPANRVAVSLRSGSIQPEPVGGRSGTTTSATLRPPVVEPVVTTRDRSRITMAGSKTGGTGVE